jgi:predicted nucleic acid-binding protein
MAIVDATQNWESLRYLGRFSHFRLIISSRVEGEAIKRLQEPPYNYDEEQAINEVRTVIKYLNLTREFKEDIDDEGGGGDKLIEKYNIIGCHYPDSTILAHLKRVGVDMVITRDRNFREVAEKEGLEVHHISTQDTIIDHRLRELFRYRR